MAPPPWIEEEALRSSTDGQTANFSRPTALMALEGNRGVDQTQTHPAHRNVSSPAAVYGFPPPQLNYPKPARRQSDVTGTREAVRRSSSVSPPLEDREPSYSSPSRTVSPLGPLPPVPSLLSNVQNVSAMQHTTVSQPSSPHRNSERAPLRSGSVPSLRALAQASANDQEKPRPPRPVRPRADSNAGSFTSTVRQGRKTLLVNGQTTFAQRVFDAGKSDLLYDLKQSTRMPWHWTDSKHGVLDLTTLQRMQQHVLQQKLTEQVRAIGERGMWMEIGIGETMKEYCQVTRDMEYMSTSALRGTASDPFLITTTDPLESLLLEEGQLVSKREHPEFKDPLLAPRLPYMKRTPASRRRLRRLIAVFAAGLALLTPYLIMTLAPTQLARVVTTCGCVAVFAVVAAASPFSTARAVLATLAYASALIIFVGVRPTYYFGP